jgi:hypothetical protein
VTPFLLLYLSGFLIGVLRADAPWHARLALALLWPIGPAAFVVIVSGLVVVSLIAFPLLGAVVLAAAAAAIFLV